MSKILFNLADFQGDDTEKLRLAGDALRANPGSTLFIPAGVYTVGTEVSRRTRRDVMDGKYGNNPQPTMFSPTYPYSRGLDLTLCRDITVSAYGAKLMIDGFMEPVCIKDAENVTIKGLVIDHVKKPFCKCVVLDVPCDGEAILRFDDRTLPEENMSHPRTICFDPKHDGLVPLGFGWNDCGKIRLSTTDYRVHGGFGKGHVGVEMYLCNTFHFRPSILVSHSKNTLIEDVTIHSHPGMGIVGFKSHNITMSRISVVPSPGYNVSTNTDATHFAACSGRIITENSRFLGHGDDAINVHNYFYYIVEKPCDNKVRIRTVTPDGTHSQEPDIPDVGHKLRLVERDDEAQRRLHGSRSRGYIRGRRDSNRSSFISHTASRQGADF